MGADPALAHLGTKSGGRELFARAGVAHPLGVEHVRSRADVIAAIARLRAVRPRIGQVGGQARRRRLRRGQRDRRAARPRPHGHARGAAEDRRARRRDAPAGGQRLAPRVLRAPRARRRDRRGADRRAGAAQPERPARAGAREARASSPRTIRSSRTTAASAAVFRPRPRTRAPSPRPPSGSARCSWRRARSAARRSTSSSAATGRARGARTRSRSTCARARRPTRCTRWSCVTGGAYDPRSGSFRTPDGSTAPLRRDRLPRFAPAVGAGRRRVARAGGAPRPGTGRLRRGVPHAQRPDRTGPDGNDRDREHRGAMRKHASRRRRTMLLSAAATVEAEVAVVA